MYLSCQVSNEPSKTIFCLAHTIFYLVPRQDNLKLSPRVHKTLVCLINLYTPLKTFEPNIELSCLTSSSPRRYIHTTDHTHTHTHVRYLFFKFFIKNLLCFRFSSFTLARLLVFVRLVTKLCPFFCKIFELGLCS